MPTDGPSSGPTTDNSIREYPKELGENAQILQRSIGSFVTWLGGNGCYSFDPYDLWSTSYGRFSRRAYFWNNVVGALLVAPVFLTDIGLPSIRKMVVKPKRYPIADAHCILAFLNLFESSADEKYLVQARRLADELLGSSTGGYSGYCWGFPFDWQSVAGFLPHNTPLITTTPYCYEAYCRLHDLTGEQQYGDVARSIARFTLLDLHSVETSSSASACSYSPVDTTRVVNANAYRGFLLVDAHSRFGDDDLIVEGQRNINFVLQSQRHDGSWYYEPGNRHNEFIDNMHTCFVLKNLCKANSHLRRADVLAAIEKGYTFYQTNLIGANGLPRPFAYVKRFQPVVLESYDIAEGIVLGLLLKPLIPGALDLSLRMAQEAVGRLQCPDGHFVTRINVGRVRNVFPYIRWPQAQMFHALTLLNKALKAS